MIQRRLTTKSADCGISEADDFDLKELYAPPEHQVELQVKQLFCSDFSSFAALVSSGFLPGREATALS